MIGRLKAGAGGADMSIPSRRLRRILLGAFSYIVPALLLSCSGAGEAPIAPSERMKTPLPAAQNADLWTWRVPPGYSAYVCQRRIDLVVVLESGEEIRFPMWTRGMPILCSDHTRFPSGGPPIVHYLVTFGDVVPWVDPRSGSMNPPQKGDREREGR